MNPIIKSNNLLNNAIAMQEAHRKGGDEALMCNYRGELSECSQSNFFLVRDGVALTPRSASGLLEGLTRGFLFEVGRDVGVPVEEATLRPADLATAQEAFITGSTRELTPVVRIDDQVVGNGRPGPVTRKLLEGFRKRAWELSAQSAAVRYSGRLTRRDDRRGQHFLSLLVGPHPHELPALASLAPAVRSDSLLGALVCLLSR